MCYLLTQKEPAATLATGAEQASQRIRQLKGLEATHTIQPALRPGLRGEGRDQGQAGVLGQSLPESAPPAAGAKTFYSLPCQRHLCRQEVASPDSTAAWAGEGLRTGSREEN